MNKLLITLFIAAILISNSRADTDMVAYKECLEDNCDGNKICVDTSLEFAKKAEFCKKNNKTMEEQDGCILEAGKVVPDFKAIRFCNIELKVVVKKNKTSSIISTYSMILAIIFYLI